MPLKWLSKRSSLSCFWLAAFLPGITSFSFGGEIPVPRAGWTMELVAETPRINHPSVVATAPDGRIFVAEDPMDITRPGHVAEGKILCFHPDGRTTLFAERLHAVFGMQYLEGKLYVLHNPKFTVFRDQNGVGVEPRDLIAQTNPNPWALDWNDHIPANFKLGMDGYFYVAVGDKGIYGAVGTDGSKVNLHGGGILRLRPDGTELEIYSTGVRNILDVALTEEDELFTYDNTDENHWMGRVTHMVDGGFYGYPFDFIPQRPYTLWMLADYGAGAATGTLAVTEDGLPHAYQGNLLLADFGQRNLRRVQLARTGGSFRAVQDEPLFLNPPANFRPVGIAFSQDGKSIFICDWQHRDTKEKAQAGRLWKLTWTGETQAKPRPAWSQPAMMGLKVNPDAADLLAALSHPARSVRLCAQRVLIERGTSVLPQLAKLLGSTNDSLARAHALWAMDQIDQGKSARNAIIALAAGSDLLLSRQAIRQLGNRKVEQSIGMLLDKLKSGDASVRFQAANALGRIGAASAVPSLVAATADLDLFARYAVFHALNRIGKANPEAWKSILEGFDHSNPRVREAVGFALRETCEKPLVEALASFVSQAKSLQAKAAALKAIAPLHHTPPEWKGEWWAYHPFRLSPPSKTNEWEGSLLVMNVLKASLDDSDEQIRTIAASALSECPGDQPGAWLLGRFGSESALSVRRALLNGLARLKYRPAGPLAARLLREKEEALAREILQLARAAGGQEVLAALLDSAGHMHENEVAVQAIETLGELGLKEAVPTIEKAARSGPKQSRRAAIKALGRLGGFDATSTLIDLCGNPSDEVRTEAIRALTPLRATNAVPALLEAWKSDQLKTEAARALAQVPDLRALPAYLDALSSKEAALRADCRKALAKVRDQALPELRPQLRKLRPEVIAELQLVYKGYPGPDAAELFAIPSHRPTPEEYLKFAMEQPGDAARGEKIFQDKAGVACINCHRVKGEGFEIGPDLSGAGAQFGTEALAESILWPSRAVREGYNVVELHLTDDTELTGMIRAETSESILLQPGIGTPLSISKNKVKGRRGTPISLMPEGLESGLSLEDFADLISYLKSLRSGA